MNTHFQKLKRTYKFQIKVGFNLKFSYIRFGPSFILVAVSAGRFSVVVPSSVWACIQMFTIFGITKCEIICRKWTSVYFDIHVFVFICLRDERWETHTMLICHPSTSTAASILLYFPILLFFLYFFHYFSYLCRWCCCCCFLLADFLAPAPVSHSYVT